MGSLTPVSELEALNKTVAVLKCYWLLEDLSKPLGHHPREWKFRRFEMVDGTVHTISEKDDKDAYDRGVIWNMAT